MENAFFEFMLPVVDGLWIAGMAVAFFTGLLAVTYPSGFVRLNDFFNRKIACRLPGFLSPDRTIAVDGMIHRFHFIFGLLLVLVSIVTLYYTLFKIDPRFLQESKIWRLPDMFYGMAAESVLTLACVVSVVGFVMGVLLLSRPALLTLLETWGNRWISTRESLFYLERSVASLDRWVERNPRFYGAVVLVLATLTLLAMALINFR